MASSDRSSVESGYSDPGFDSLIDGPEWVGTVTKTCGNTAGHTRTFADQDGSRTAFAMLKAMTSTMFQFGQSNDVKLAGCPEIWDEMALTDHHQSGANQGGVRAVSLGRSSIKNDTVAQPVHGPSLHEGFDVAIFVSKGL